MDIVFFQSTKFILLSVFFIYLKIFFPCRLTAAQMPFILVQLEDIVNALIQGRIDSSQLCGHVFMYRAFADTKMLGRFSHSRAVLHDIISKQLTPLPSIAIIFEIYHLSLFPVEKSDQICYTVKKGILPFYTMPALPIKEQKV